jgi:hypothetical protein
MTWNNCADLPMDKTLYVVSGFMRTGTSMMMRALEAGGLDACYKQSRDVMKARHADKHYDPNIGGLYELERSDYREWDFPHGYEGKLIKALNMGVPRMSVMPNGIRVVFMRRITEEIRQSYEAFFPGSRLRNIEDLDKNMEDIIARIENRKDILSIHVFWYGEVVKSPLSHFEDLKTGGWPIDTKKAASIIDPKYHRYHEQRLTIGVI